MSKNLNPLNTFPPQIIIMTRYKWITNLPWPKVICGSRIDLDLREDLWITNRPWPKGRSVDHGLTLTLGRLYENNIECILIMNLYVKFHFYITWSFETKQVIQEWNLVKGCETLLVKKFKLYQMSLLNKTL